jgi:hypothetical protein
MHDTLETAPPRAVILGSGDHRLGAMLYGKHALHLRDDVEYVDAWLLLDDWYRARASERLGVALIAPQNRSLSTPTIAAQILSTGRPLLLADVFSPAIPNAYSTYPIGTLVRVLAPNESPPDVGTLVEQNAELSKRFVAPSLPAPPLGTWDGDLRRSYVEPWLFLAREYERMGDASSARACLEYARAVAPAAPED